MIPGNVATLTYALTVAGVPTNATVTLTVTSPTGVTSTPTVTNPSTGNYSANVPVNETGYWSYLWTATGAATDAEAGVFQVGDTRPVWTPTAGAVAGYIPNRTQATDGSGVALGEFTTATRPTLAQVNQLCAIVARQVEAACGITLPADLTDSASDVAAIGAAARVEMSYYRDTDSRYADLDAQYEQDLKMLVDAVIARRDNVTIPGDGDTPELPPSPLGTFPPPMFIRNERW